MSAHLVVEREEGEVIDVVEAVMGQLAQYNSISPCIPERCNAQTLPIAFRPLNAIAGDTALAMPQMQVIAGKIRPG